MIGRYACVLALAALTAAAPAGADRYETTIGGDRLVTGDRLDETISAPRDLLVSGARVMLRGDVGQDVFGAGFSVEIEGTTDGNVTASGARVRLDGTVGGDATLSGFVVTLDDGAAVSGNARLFAGTATQRGSVDGALVITAADVQLDGTVTGDVHILANSLTFGPDARVGGRLMLALPDEIDVPSEVAAAGQVSYVAFDPGDWREFGEFAWDGMPERPSAITIVGGYLLTLAFLLITGGALLVIMPERVAHMRRMALNRPGITVLLGSLGFSALVGLVPVSAMTLVGLPLLPIAILTVIVAWILGYLLGAYVVAMGVARALGLGDHPATSVRLGVLAAAITVAALLNFVPVLGWILNIGLVFLGLGALTEGVVRWTLPPIDPRGDNEMLAHETGAS
ncbi:MAG: polymer-forming cytoskeletal protein [Pseudomonadota bacterium]